jgi:RimJ/RimL family protein N-acetyltransferase
MSARHLGTPHLRLQIITQDDLDDVFATMNYEHTADIVSVLSWPMTLAQAQEVVDQAVRGWENQSEFLYLAYAKEGGALVGYGAIHRNAPQAIEIGYWLCEEAQGRGYASELAGALIDLAFTFPDCEKVYATTALGNAASRRVLEKNGLRHVGEKGVQTVEGRVRPSLLFERLRA